MLKVANPGEIELRVTIGLQADCFTPGGIKTFLSGLYTVTDQCDRMGYRLDGKKIQHLKGGNIISDGIAMGVVQVPGHGQLLRVIKKSGAKNILCPTSHIGLVPASIPFHQ
jgi:allophanate hydrolase subunit 2